MNDTMDYQKEIHNYIKKETDILESLPVEDINTALNIIENARISRRRIFTCGNGGSAATASHFVCDLENGASRGKDIRFDAECLSDNTPVMTAFANDLSYDDIFAERLKNKGVEGDILICISGSGNSTNILRAAEIAKSKKMITIGLVGYDGGKLKTIVDHCIHVNINDMQITEDVHMILDHLIMSTLSQKHV